MTDKEKQAIEMTKQFLVLLENQKQLKAQELKIKEISNEYLMNLNIVLNLIEKQQTEIRQYDKTLHDQIIKDYDMESKLKSELEKKDKIINLMSEQLTSPIHSKEWVIEYYTKEVEGK